MKKKSLKISAIIAACLAISAVGGLSASAAPTLCAIWGTGLEGHNFKKAWDDHKDLWAEGEDLGDMWYGYDTDWFNEDYCICYVIDHDVKAAICRNGGNQWYESSGYGTPANPAEIWKLHSAYQDGYFTMCYGSL